MPRTSNRAEDAAKGSFVVYMGLTVMLIMIFLIGRNTYSTFLQTKMDEQVFSVKANCSINRIISRFQQNNKSASIFVNSSFVVSVQWSTENGTVRQEFEEYMVPTPLQPNPINSFYLCFVDPTNSGRRPLQYKPDVASKRKDFILALILPVVLLSPGVLMGFALILSESIKPLVNLYRQRQFLARTQPASITQ